MTTVLENVYRVQHGEYPTFYILVGQQALVIREGIVLQLVPAGSIPDTVTTTSLELKETTND